MWSAPNTRDKIKDADVDVSTNHVTFLVNRFLRLISSPTSTIFVSGTSGITTILTIQECKSYTLYIKINKPFLNKTNFEYSSHILPVKFSSLRKPLVKKFLSFLYSSPTCSSFYSSYKNVWHVIVCVIGSFDPSKIYIYIYIYILKYEHVDHNNQFHVFTIIMW